MNFSYQPNNGILIDTRVNGNRFVGDVMVRTRAVDLKRKFCVEKVFFSENFCWKSETDVDMWVWRNFNQSCVT